MRSYFLVFVVFVIASASAYCGDNLVDAPGEQCDGLNLDGKSCSSFCYSSGTLRCSSSCVFDTSSCVSNICGDNVALQGEQCDGTDLKGQSCSTVGFDYGTLHCGPCTWNTSDCHNWVCGDAIITASKGEQCEGSNLNGATCESLGYHYHVSTGLSCDASCHRVTGNCRNYYCGDGLLTPDGIPGAAAETCDGSLLQGMTCASLGFDGGALGCASSCADFDTHACYKCGDNVRGGSEVCDGSDLNGKSCTDFGFEYGNLHCSSSCGGFDVSDCHMYCGNGVVDAARGESCDGSAFSGGAAPSCASQGFVGGGVVTCSSTCTYNTGGCVTPQRDCVSGKSTLLEVALCYELASVSSNTLTTMTYPSAAKAAAMQSLVNTMLLNNGQCSNIAIPSDLLSDIQVRQFTDSGITYCLALDHKDADNNGKWDNGYFLFIVPNSRYDVQRRLHLSAPHPGSSENSTITQTIKVFQAVGANSVMISGTQKNANLQTAQNPCRTNSQYPTDAVENNLLAFQTIFSQVYATSNAQSWNPSYIQFHGMTGTQCYPTSGAAATPDILITNGASAPSYYPTGCLANQLRDYLKSNPYVNYTNTKTMGEELCSGLGAYGVQGRLVNGVAPADLCGTINPTTVNNKWLHIEQKLVARGPAVNHAPFFAFIKANYATDCASGRTYDSVSQMCTP